MGQLSLDSVHDTLFAWCRKNDFAGHDPFDALNSRLFQATPFRNFRTPRLLFTQLTKRSPVSLRGLTGVPRQQNAKGVALFALAALASYRRKPGAETETIARERIGELLQLKIKGYRGAAWGYNFDWQSRNFFAPRSTPTIVPTAFAARSFVEAFDAFHEPQYLETAQSVCDFILKDLRRTVDAGDEICFSYSSNDDTQIFNASLLAAETLAAVGSRTGETSYCDFAVRAARFVIRRQGNDGSWMYGAGEKQQWIDNFHTAYVLSSLFRIGKLCETRDVGIQKAVSDGYDFWRKSFFLADGWPKYYHDRLHPADSHAAATAIVTLTELRELDDGALALAEKVASWAVGNLRDPAGYFYYQRRRWFTVRTPFMRWTQAWMLYALARLLEEKQRV
ncbi:MAG TPA: hypothetical protein VJV03_17905 [Pyrinomonadaceae bacterium]|nr:hypothetical protein [Pyrinomonadaceae bacterium]